MPWYLFRIWIVCCALLALGFLGIWIVAVEGGDLALMFLVCAIFSAVGLVLFGVVAWALARE